MTTMLHPAMQAANERLAKLARLKNRRTRYEIIATKGDAKVLVGYSARTGRRGLLSMLQQNGEAWTRFVGSNPKDCNISFRTPASAGADCEGWHIRFSGRTQRDSICSGEVPFFTK